MIKEVCGNCVNVGSLEIPCPCYGCYGNTKFTPKPELAEMYRLLDESTDRLRRAKATVEGVIGGDVALFVKEYPNDSYTKLWKILEGVQ